MNDWTIKDQYPLPRINVLLNDLHSLTLMTKFDVRDGYYNIKMDPEMKHLAAFRMTEGLYEPNVMAFRLNNAPMTFQRFMDRILKPLKTEYLWYLH